MKSANKTKAWLAALACGGIPLITTASCDPYSGVINIYRDDNFGRFDGFLYDEIAIYDNYSYFDCLLGCW